jgi:predicted Fe-Mo cluster-binding NifX family protein
MYICIPVEADHGLDSPVCAHFGSAPLFMMIDTETRSCRALPNTNRQHSHGMCMPLAALDGEQVDALVVGGIGMGALSKLQARGINVFLSDRATVREAIDAHSQGRLQPVTPANACAHHGASPHGQGTHAEVGAPGALVGMNGPGPMRRRG